MSEKISLDSSEISDKYQDGFCPAEQSCFHSGTNRQKECLNSV